MLAGLTAPLIYYFGYVRKSLSQRIIWIWNLIGLGLLLNLVVQAILSGPFPFQQFAFDQPDIAFLYFPFCLDAVLRGAPAVALTSRRLEAIAVGESYQMSALPPFQSPSSNPIAIL